MQEHVSDPLEGTLVDNRYAVRSKLARGGMSTVYLATDQRLERDVALKVLASKEPVSILLFGEPGTGKTEFARTLAAEAGSGAM